MWKSGHHGMCENPYARVTILPSGSKASGGAMDVKIDLAKTVADEAMQKDIEFPEPNAESVICKQNPL